MADIVYYMVDIETTRTKLESLNSVYLVQVRDTDEEVFFDVYKNHSVSGEAFKKDITDLNLGLYNVSQLKKDQQSKLIPKPVYSTYKAIKK